MNTKINLIYTYTHLPSKVMYIANPPEDITKDKYNDIAYLLTCIDVVEELEDNDFVERKDGVSPYSKEVIIQHFNNRIEELRSKQSDD